MRSEVPKAEGVVEERAGNERPALVVDRFFPERLADTLGQATVNLAVDDHRVDHVAAVVDRHVADEVDVYGAAEVGVHRAAEVDVHGAVDVDEPEGVHGTRSTR